MKFLQHAEITSLLEAKVGPVKSFEEIKQPYLLIHKNQLITICEILKTEPYLYFDYLNCITAVDLGPDQNKMELWYTITSIPNEKSVQLKLEISRPGDNELAEAVPSLANLWKTADWHEREIFDLMGIPFSEHPDLRRILLPADWVGYPLRKDYKEEATYHELPIKYDR